jgi:hypothetical protein
LPHSHPVRTDFNSHLYLNKLQKNQPKTETNENCAE